MHPLRGRWRPAAAPQASLLAASTLDDVVRTPSEDWLLAHEFAHQWFAWAVQCADFSDFWLNEGFATFLVGVLKEERWGSAAYQAELALWRERSRRVHSAGKDAPLSHSRPGGSLRPPLQEAELQPRGVTYSRGALVLHRLRAELGEAAFWAGVRRYVAGPHRHAARTEDLRNALEAASGRDLNPFFMRWVYSAAPDL